MVWPINAHWKFYYGYDLTCLCVYIASTLAFINSNVPLIHVEITEDMHKYSIEEQLSIEISPWEGFPHKS